MNTPTLKTCAPALAIALLPAQVQAQDTNKVLPDNTTANTVILNTPPTDVFEKQPSDSTTCNFEDYANLADTVQIAEEKVQEPKKDEIKEKIKQDTKNFISSPDTKSVIGPTFKYSISQELPTFGVKADLKNGNTVIGGDINIGKNNKKSLLAYNLYGEYDFDMDKGFYVYPKIGLGGAKISYENANDSKQNLSAIVPKVAAGVKYEKELNDDLKLGGALELGGGAVINKAPESTDYNKSYVCNEISPEFLAKVFADYKNIVIFVSGGKEAGNGYNVQSGVGFKFK